MKKKKEIITGFITRTRRSKKAVMTVSMLSRVNIFNRLFQDFITNNKYISLDVEYTDKEVYLKFFKTEKGNYPIKIVARGFGKSTKGFFCSALKKYLLKDIYEGKGIAHYSISKTSEKDCFALKVMTSDFE